MWHYVIYIGIASLGGMAGMTLYAIYATTHNIPIEHGILDFIIWTIIGAGIGAIVAYWL